MVDIRGFNGGMNTDAAPELLPSGDYTYAMNVSNGSEGITNILGNRIASGFPAHTFPGTEWICGAFFDKVRQRIIYFTNHSGGNHRIISYSVPNIGNTNGIYTVLFEDFNGVFSDWESSAQFDPDLLIKDIKVIHREYEGDLYYFIDQQKRLLKFNYNTLIPIQNQNDLCAFGWTDANYDGTLLRDGTPISQVTDPVIWAGLTVPAWCYLDNISTNNGAYGKLYNWYAISHPLFAPAGYRVPTQTDWTNLIDCLGGSSVAGGKMKNAGTQYWLGPNTGATNESLFNGLPGGYRTTQGVFRYGYNLSGYWWSSTEYDTDNSWNYQLDFDAASVSSFLNDKRNGYSVRLIKQ